MSFSFNKYANHRSQILMTMSILNSHLPDCNIPTSPIKFLVGLEPYLKLLKECHADIPKRKKGKTEERLSMASHSVEVMNKYLKSDASNAAILQQMLALLMQVWNRSCQSGKPMTLIFSRYWQIAGLRPACWRKVLNCLYLLLQC